MCRVSIVTSVYNCEAYIAETVQSIIDQTFQDWEFILINDCSKDKSAEIIQNFHDDRIRFYENEINQGQCKSLNRGIAMARGEYIARLDHDDLCYPDRLKKQVEYMDKHPEVVLYGSWFDVWEEGKIIKRVCPPIQGTDELAYSLCFGDYCIAHSTFMIRRNAMIDNNIWYGDYLYAEDYDLLLKLVRVGKIDYTSESLVIYRVFSDQCTQTYSRKMIDCEKDKLRCLYLDEENFSGTPILKKAILRHLQTREDYKQFIKSMIDYADYCGLPCSKGEFYKSKCLKFIFLEICIKQKYNLSLLISYVMSPFKDNEWFFSSRGLKFIIKCIIHYYH